MNEKNHTLLKLFLACVFCIFHLTTQSQSPAELKEKPLSVEICLARTNILGTVFPGMSGHYIFYLSERFGTGAALFTCQTQVDQSFGYAIVNPQLLFSQYGWINQYIVLNNRYVKFKCNFTTGLDQARLIDDTRRYYSGQIIQAPKLDQNLFYFIQPGCDLSLRLLGPINLTAGINYRLAFGRSHFADKKDFRGNEFNLGITLTNFDRVYRNRRLQNLLKNEKKENPSNH